MNIDRDDIGCMEVEKVNGDNLTIVLSSYFSDHMNRPKEDENSEDEDNFYWGDWVEKKTNEALDLIANQINKGAGK